VHRPVDEQCVKFFCVISVHFPEELWKLGNAVFPLIIMNELDGTEASKLELFRALSNKGRVNFDRKRPAPESPRIAEVQTDEDEGGEDDMAYPYADRSENARSEGSGKRGRYDEASSIHSGGVGDRENEYIDPSAAEREDRHVKMTMLHELARMRDGGAVLSRDFTMRDPLSDIEFEFERQKQILSARSGIDFMKQTIRLGLLGVEFVNARFSLLRLEGYSDDVCRDDMRRFDRPLQRIHKRLFRRSTMNPFVELAMLIFGSAVMIHFKNSMMGPRPAGAAPGLGSLAGLMGNGGLANLASIFGGATARPQQNAPRGQAQDTPRPQAAAGATRMAPPKPVA
jgi:hypothetical protein